ncbi:thiamine phosphate synthase [Enterovirga aerilata]|uniref:Thiamine phosphate synthase n=1 Tax=Enterovirga aerilata TaxID=2730920 RepID=A0A849IDH3_9HYPH|nr:thiamine phosphate synthase [Enterovirga sp. DB1703]NNM74265.1 thiamine phosphate synthase [Enterovirga sp. DB1703]
MTEFQPRLYLVSPLLAGPEPFRDRLAEACGAAETAAVLLRLAPADERTLVKMIKAAAPAAQDAGAAVLVEVLGEHDAALVAARGGADGVHGGAGADLTGLRQRLRDGRMLGAGQLRTKHDAMTAGEAGVDYVMFGEPRPDGYVPPLDQTVERAEWWAEIFETPCVAYAPTLEAVRDLARTGAEFVALGDAVWSHPAGPGEALRIAAEALRQGAPEAAR